MSTEKYTRTKTELPRGDLLVAMRLVAPGFGVLSDLEAATLHDLLPRQFGSAAFSGMSVEDGNIYVGFKTAGSGGLGINDEAVAMRDSTALLWHGLARCALNAEVTAAMCDSITLINPDKPLHASFAYMETDVTRPVRDALADYDIEAPVVAEEAVDLMAELERTAF